MGLSLDKIYNGKPCKKCKSTVKWITSQSCVVCTRKRVKNRSSDIGIRYLSSPKGKEKRGKWLEKYIKSDRRKHVLMKYKSKPNSKQKRNKYYIENKINWKKSQLKNSYGISLDNYLMLLEQQNNMCAICNRHKDELKRSLHVDHDHKTNDIRGLLCHNCNIGLGLFKDDIKILEKAIRYLSCV